MTEGTPIKRSLSARLAGMSFMKRGAERELRDTYAKRQKKRETDAHWVAPPAPAGELDEDDGPYIIVEGADAPTTLALGRQSFGRFNTALERRNEEIAAGRDPDAVAVPVVAAPGPAPSLHSNAEAFAEPVMATPHDDPTPRRTDSASASRASLHGARVTGPRPLISKKHSRRPGKAGGVDENALRKKRRQKKR